MRTGGFAFGIVDQFYNLETAKAYDGFAEAVFGRKGSRLANI
jgi:hypothetical protein